MKSGKLANKFWLWLAAIVITAFFCVTPLASSTLTATAATTIYAAPTYQYNASWYDELGITAYNNYLQELQSTNGLKKVTVAVVDSGLDYTSSAVFDGRVITQYAKNFNLTDKRTAADWHQDESGHGTHVAGVIAAGSMANVQILPIRIFVGENNAMTFSVFHEAINYVCQMQRTLNIVAVNLSLGTKGISRDDYATEAEFNAAFARDLNTYQPYVNRLRRAGILPIAAAGNIDTKTGETDTKSYYAFPASCEGAISVSAYYRDGATAKRASFSYYNERISLSAPGAEIWSACSSYVVPTDSSSLIPYPQAGEGVHYFKNSAGNYIYVRQHNVDGATYYDLRSQGTSMATPFVTLCYALLCSDPGKTTAEAWGVEWDDSVDTAAPYYYLNPQHKALLLNATDFYLKNEPGKTDVYFGYGGVNVKAFAADEVTKQASKTEDDVIAPSLPTYTAPTNTTAQEVANWAGVFWLLVGMALVIVLIGFLRTYAVRRNGFSNVINEVNNDDDA